MIEETLARSIFKINPQAIAKAAIESISKLHPEVREILFQSKNEQTFSSLLASELNSTFGLKHTSFLTEIKGETITRKDLKKVPNFHDIALLDADGKIEVTVENKAWYHFDGAKGVHGKIGQTVIEGLNWDIGKTLITMKKDGSRGFILFIVMTPKIFTKYESSHKTSLKRAGGNLGKYRSDGASGFLQLMKSQNELKDISHAPFSSGQGSESNFCLDVFCAELVK